MDASLSKSERLCGKIAVGGLMEHGKVYCTGCLRCKYLVRGDDAPSRIMVSVPKRSFKRAVKRNLLKRRIRESYRLQKALLGPGMDVLFLYTPREVLSSAEIFADMTVALQHLSSQQ